MSRYEEDQQYRAGSRARGSTGREERDDLRQAPGEDMRDHAAFPGAASTRQGERGPFGPQPGREPDMQNYDGYAETSSGSGAGRRYAREQYEDAGSFSGDSQNAGRGGPSGHGSGTEGYRTGYSQGRRGYSRSADADTGLSGYGQPDSGRGGYGRYAGAGTDPRGNGRFRGYGPKGYRRSDEGIAEDFNERLTEDPLLDASDITVQVSDGLATLQGSVESRWMKRRAEDVADACRGVQDVRNNIRVAGTSSHTTPERPEAADTFNDQASEAR